MGSQHRVALVTGGSRGIGAGVVRRLTQDGIRVAFTYLQAKDRAQEVARETGALAIQADSGDPGALTAAVHQTAKELDGLDILVNNAFTNESLPLADVPLATFDKIVGVNIRAPWVAIQAADQYLGDGGRIINMGSIFADRIPPGPHPGLAMYNMTKAALAGMTRALARELSPRRITVNTIQPGIIGTEAADPVYLELMESLTPLGAGVPADVAGVVAYLASPEARFVTGATINVDGGFSV